ncbi:MAG TPA: ACT domain-containing protein [Chlamydiales bacterium]|nr:MAG: hypothetical protein A3F67_11100 [Verrucomicrobia bacterium RIFCSPHIGHO2_12_FULL_41_10]HLB53113.1 ACT domain-containing protein [Chlamydiales bacterium]
MRKLIFLQPDFSICKVSQEELSRFLSQGSSSSFFLSQTEIETTILAETKFLKWKEEKESNWNAFYIEGVISFDTPAVLAPILQCLGSAGISILVQSTFNTDYVFFKSTFQEKVRQSLQESYDILNLF